MTIIGAFFFALNLVLVGFIGKDFDAIALMLAEFVWCALLFGAGAVLTEGGPSMAWARWDIVLCIAYLVIGSTVIAQVFQTIAIQNLPTSEASVILSTECIFAMLVSVIFTGETLTVPSLCGFALIFGAILLSEIQLPSAKRQRGTTEGDQKNSAAIPAAKHMSSTDVRKLARNAFCPFFAMALKFTLMPSAAMAMPSTM